MSTKPVFSFNSNNSDNYTASPFWVKPTSKANKFKKVMKGI
jgi:hypothetical protein